MKASMRGLSLTPRFRIHRLGVLGLSAAAAVTFGSVDAGAQSESAIEDEFSVQRFHPGPGPRNFITSRGARTDGEFAWSAGLFANYALEPFVVVSCVSETDCDDQNVLQPNDVKVVENLVTADLLGSLTVIPRVQLGLRLPLTFADGQGITDTGAGDPDELSGFGLGDIELEAKVRVWGEPKDTVVIGLAPFITAPLGTVTAEDKFIGDPLPTAGLRAIFDGHEGAFRFGANLTGLFRGEGRVGSTTVGPAEFRYGVAVGYDISPVIGVVADGFGSTKFSSKNGTNSLEIDAAGRVTPLGSGISIMFGAGAGVIEGVGVPAVRGFLGVTYVAESRDRDGDGLDDNVDQCPTEPEDKDGKQDEDGCPDTDNDDDSVPDHLDKCPAEAEDPDGFEDLDGCPELDNDKDGIPDDNDACRDEPETKNGFKDEDGCPDEADTDEDGVPDSKDKCINEKEDTDGFQDTDGCPDPDNDGDGVPDEKDECFDEPETQNGFEDEDGCPDEKP